MLAISELPDLFDHAVERYRQGTLEEAATLFETVIQADPNHEAALHFLGILSQKQGAFAKAVEYLSRAVAISPGNYDYQFQLATALIRTNAYTPAIAHFTEVIRLKPDFPPAYNNLATIHISRGQLALGETYCKKAIELDPEYFGAYTNLGRLYCDQGRHAEAEACYRTALRINPHFAEAHSNLLMCLCYSGTHSPQAVFDEHRTWATTHCAGTRPSGYRNKRSSDRRIRIGYVSPDFREHSVAYYLEPVLANHDREKFEIFCYANVHQEDEVTRRLKQYVDGWRSITALTDQAAAELIRSDTIDILVDLAGHTAYNRLTLFGMKPAPVQVSYLGYPNTSGCDAIDYRITDAFADEPGADLLYTEKLVRLSGGFLCYQPPQATPDITLTRAPGPIVFGSFNNAAKITDAALDVWAEILARVPKSSLLIKSKQFNDPDTCTQFMQRMAGRGSDRSRIILHGYNTSQRDHLKSYDRIDIALDTFPYAGTTTTCEALLMGVPVITLAGTTHAARVGVSILSRVGLTSLVASDTTRYIGLATYLAGNPDQLAKLRGGLRNALLGSPLCDAPSFTRSIENAFAGMWQRWVGEGRS